jgi:hypothetical protein
MRLPRLPYLLQKLRKDIELPSTQGTFLHPKSPGQHIATHALPSSQPHTPLFARMSVQRDGQQFVAVTQVKRSIPRELFGRFELIEVRPDARL